MTVVNLTGDDFKQRYFPKYHEFQDITADMVKDAKYRSDTFHDNNLFGFYKQAERCLKTGRTSSLDIFDQWVLLCGSSMTCHRFLTS